MLGHHFLIRAFMIATAFLVILPAIEAGGQVTEITEAIIAEPQKDEEEELSKACLSAVKSYEEVRTLIDERIEYLESVAVIGDLLELKDGMEEGAGIPKECSKEVGLAVDSMIEKALGEKAEDVDFEKMRYAAAEMEAELMPQYLKLSDVFDDVCAFCGRKPLKLAKDPLECRAADLDKKRKCSNALIIYENAREALMYRRDLCRQSAKIEGMDQILFWFQGRDDLPLACAVMVKEFMGELRSRAEGKSEASRYAFAVAQEKCGRALFPIYMRYGIAVQGVCESCKNADKKLKDDEMSCY
jgi:hypothetical protein